MKQVLQTPNEVTKDSYVSKSSKKSIQREGKRKTEAIHVQSKPRSCGWGATHLRPAVSIKLPTQRGSKWVCVQAQKRGSRKQKAMRRSERREKGRVTLAVTLYGTFPYTCAGLASLGLTQPSTEGIYISITTGLPNSELKQQVDRDSDIKERL